MADPSPTGKTGDLIVSSNGTDPSQAAPRHCAFCGQELLDTAGAPERFGEVFCSEAHAGEFAKGVRAARVQLAAAADVAPAGTSEGARRSATTTKPGHWKMALKMAACCAAPLLVGIVLAGGAGALFGAAASVLPLLAGLACPIGMFFLMRGMMKGGQAESGKERDKEQ